MRLNGLFIPASFTKFQYCVLNILFFLIKQFTDKSTIQNHGDA
jgi:hypothetical protein